MARYKAIYVSYAEEQYNSLSGATRVRVDQAVRELEADPRRGDYDSRTCWWTYPFSFGMLTYSIEDRWIRISILRITTLKQ